jgi:hypothetical protein
MRACRYGLIGLLIGVSEPLAAAEWLDARTLPGESLRELCTRSSGIKSLARMQMMISLGAEWRRLSRQGLEVERIAIGQAPLDSSKCYVFVRAGPAGEFDGIAERRAFEARDFAHSPERTLVLVVGPQFTLSEPEP